MFNGKYFKQNMINGGKGRDGLAAAAPTEMRPANGPLNTRVAVGCGVRPHVHTSRLLNFSMFYLIPLWEDATFTLSPNPANP